MTTIDITRRKTVQTFVSAADSTTVGINTSSFSSRSCRNRRSFLFCSESNFLRCSNSRCCSLVWSKMFFPPDNNLLSIALSLDSNFFFCSSAWNSRKHNYYICTIIHVCLICACTDEFLKDVSPTVGLCLRFFPRATMRTFFISFSFSSIFSNIFFLSSAMMLSSFLILFFSSSNLAFCRDANFSSSS